MRYNFKFNSILLGVLFGIFASIPSEAQYNWVKDANPVIAGQSEDWDESILYPAVIHKDDLFKIWYCGLNYTDVTRQIGYAESADGITWEKYEDPVLPGGDPGSWDIHRYPGTVLFINDTLRMWYYGSTNSADNFSIGYAWCVLENLWNVRPDPVLEKGEQGEWDDLGVLKHSVHYDEAGTYHMYYSGMSQADYKMRIGHATSPDGINWQKDTDNNPVITIGEPSTFYHGWVGAHGLVEYNNTLHMFFEGFDGANSSPFDGYLRVGYAWSTDFVNWNIETELWPVLDVGEQGAFDENWAANPTVLVHDNQLKMWYTGCSSNWVHKIGYASGDIISSISPKNSNNTLKNQLYAFPNPFIDQLNFQYELQAKSAVKLELFNHSGQLISTLVNEVIHEGKHEIILNGSHLLPGVYFCVLKTNNGIMTKKIVKL